MTEGKNSLISLLEDSVDSDGKKRGKERGIPSILYEFQDKIGKERYSKFERESLSNPSQFSYVFGLYYSAATDYMKKYAVKGMSTGVYFAGTVYSALRAFEKDLRRKGYNIYNSVWLSTKDTFTKMRLLNFIDKSETAYLKKNGWYRKESEAIYPLLIAMNAIAILPLAKEGLITPHVYTAFLVGLGDMFFCINISIFSAMWRGVHVKNKYEKRINYLLNKKDKY